MVEGLGFGGECGRRCRRGEEAGKLGSALNEDQIDLLYWNSCRILGSLSAADDVCARADHVSADGFADEEAEKQVSALNEELTSLKLTVAELEKERSRCLSPFSRNRNAAASSALVDCVWTCYRVGPSS